MYGFGQEACGVYTPGTQFDIDVNKLHELRFNDEDIKVMEYVMKCRGRVYIADVQGLGIDYDRAERIKYMFDIVSGRINIESKDDLAKHFRKMFGKHKRIGIADLAISKVSKVPRWAVVGGIKDDVYSSLNSANLPVDKRLYKVEKTGARILVSTKSKLVIPYKYPKKIDSVLEVLGKDKDGKIYIAIDKAYCRLCNRYIVVASLRLPETHHGMIEIICLEGTRIYVYAKTLGVRESVTYSGGTARVYDFGIKSNEIQYRVRNIAEGIYKKLLGVYAEYVPANEDFKLLAPVEKKVEIEE